MSGCAFAHAVYGVVLDDDEQEMMKDLLKKAIPIVEACREDWNDLSDCDQRAELIRYVDASGDFIRLLRSKYESGADARIVWTGNEDDRPAECYTDSELYVLGYGMISFPEANVPLKFRTHAEWLSWVEMPS